MSQWFDTSDPLPVEFDGTVRLFPLPNLVLFPHVLQPLHIFEPRYRSMVAEALETDRLIAMVLSLSGSEEEHDERPPVSPMACLGRIAGERKLDDGRYYVLLHGVKRVEILTEMETGKPFRVAKVALRDDYYPPGDQQDRLERHEQLLECFQQLFPNLSQLSQKFHQLLESDLPLGMLTDILGYCLGLEVQAKQALLEELDVDARAEKLLVWLRTALSQQAIRSVMRSRFPPDFSSN